MKIGEDDVDAFEMFVMKLFWEKVESVDFFGIIRKEERVFDVLFHVRFRDVGDRFGMIFEFYHAVDFGFGVIKGDDVRDRNIEKIVGFDNFQTFVDERCGFDGNLFAHFPSWMIQNLGGSDFLKLLFREIPKRAAGAGEINFFDFFFRVRAEDFENGIMFGVERDDLFEMFF